MLDPGEENLKVPAWLNDVTLYHNRGNTTFTGEDSLYGDFFGLDDLFTEHPRVVNGMIDVYETWIGDFGIDGFRIDTMKHVNDEFWQKFGPEVLSYAAAVRARASSSCSARSSTPPGRSPRTSPPRTRCRRCWTSRSRTRPATSPRRASRPTSSAPSSRDDDWYTDANSNVYQLPTFLGNHDMGRIGYFVDADNPGAADAELVARDRLAHELMYFSRGNPVIYYGDEQGFTGTGGDQVARQTMFASQVPDYLDDDLLGTDATHATDNFVPAPPALQPISQLAYADQARTRRCATAPTSTATPPERLASTRSRGSCAASSTSTWWRSTTASRRSRPRSRPTSRTPPFQQVYGSGPQSLTSDEGRNLS